MQNILLFLADNCCMLCLNFEWQEEIDAPQWVDLALQGNSNGERYPNALAM